MSADVEALRRRVHTHLLATTGATPVAEQDISDAVRRIAPLLDDVAVGVLSAKVYADIHGLGPLEPLLEDSDVTDVMVVGERGVWVERGGRLQDTGLRLGSDETLHLIERIVAPLGLRVDRAAPMVDARLADGSRVNAIVPPLAIDGPCLTIRRFGAKAVPLDAYANPDLHQRLVAAVRQRRNILISGGTGAGKTTLLNAMAQFIDDGERVITVEDAAELRIARRHVVRLESRPANAEGVGRTTLRELVKNALRMRPDRIILGEVRGAEALDMLQAMNTGHEGSLSTCHANSTRDALARVETMVLMADVDLPLAAIREQLASAIDVVVQVRRGRDGTRRISEVIEVFGDRGGYRVRSLLRSDGTAGPFEKPSRHEVGDESCPAASGS
jgi:pilus assembly protein CpaF